MFETVATKTLQFINQKKIYIILALLLFFVLVLWGRSTYNFTDVKFSHPAFKQDSSYFVEYDSQATVNLYTYDATVESDIYKQKFIRVIPDDCIKEIKVNGVVADLSNQTNYTLCDVSRGFEFEISKYLIPGNNSISFQITDAGGRTGLKFVESYLDRIHLTYLILTIILISLLFVKLVIDLKFSKVVVLIFLAAMLFRLFYFANTEWYQRTHDVWGHIPYIEYLEEKMKLPAPTDCWECHQQPLYYIVSAGISEVFKFTGIENKYFIFKIFSLESEFYFGGYLVVSLLIMRLFKLKKYLFWLVTFIFLFWPTNILHATRIGNDPISYLFIIISLYYAVKFYQTNFKKYFFGAIITVMIATLTKLTGVAFLPGIIIEYFVLNHPNDFTFSSIKSFFRENLGTLLISLTIIILGLVLALQEPILNGFKSNWLTVNVPGDSMLVSNNFNNWVYIDVGKFLMQPNINTFEPQTGSAYFLHTLLKTSMFAEFGIDNRSETWTNLARVMSLAILLYFTCIILGVFTNIFDTKRFKQYLPLVLFTLLTFGSLVYFRFKMNYTPNQDFRYILPVFLPLILLNIRNVKLEDMKVYEILSLLSLLSISIMGISFVFLTIFM